VARPPAGRPNADEPVQPDDEESIPFTEDPLDSDDANDEDDTRDEAPDAVDDLGHEPERTATVDRFWKRVRVDPLEIALPGGAGYTLRAYRQNTEITPADVSGREDEVPMARRRGTSVELDDDGDLLDEAEITDDLADEDRAEDEVDEDFDEDLDEEAVDEVDESAGDVVEEVPLFLSHGGHLLVFRSVESLVEFVLSDAEHDLQQIDTWDSVTQGIRSEYVVSLPDDTYELDLVVKNLRGGHDAWDPELLVRSGQLARDLGHALRIEPVVLALAPGSPLDDLDDALRATTDGGLGSFFARRKLKKIGAETASLGWRTVIGKISAVVDWRD
jgi:hypothetical protein